MWIKIIVTIMLILNLAGCATMQKKSELNSQVQQLQMQISELESESQRRDEEIYRLEKELAKAQGQTPKKAASANEPIGTSKKITRKNIQTALKNAGLYDGPIDGKIGKNTKKAIKEFQRLNGLTPDGIAGKKTWVKLQEFLYQK